MIRSQFNSMFGYFNDKISNCNEQYKKFQLEGRFDEGNFEKIKVNVYGIFNTMLTLAINTAKEENEVYAFYMKKLDEIPLNWEASYKKAVEYNDEEKIHIENIKLGVVKEISNAFEKTWEEVK